MTPKEKAIEFVGKYTTVLSLPFSKEFALIAVDEILNITGSSFIFEVIDYWMLVKQEIELL